MTSQANTREASIEQLSAATRAKLRSTQILTSLPQIISELLQNSLDAGARQVDIGVNCEEWSCWVRDNGAGINKEGLAILGIGSEDGDGRYGTSKAYAPDSLDTLSTFGFRGEALASAADLSCLEISSRTARSRENWSIILKGGKSLYTGPSIRWRRESPGTTVCIRDAFYNLPIRRLSHPSASRTLELIRQELEAYALVFPGVSFSLENTSLGRESNSNKDRITRIPKTASSLTAFRHLYGRALVKHVDEIDVTSGEMKLEGFISLEGAYSKAYQFLYINRHPITTCDLHRIIDTRFGTSSFVRHAFDELGETKLRSTIRRSPRKTEKKPVYVLNLIIPPQYIDNCLEPAKASVQFQDKNAVTSFLSSEIQSFLMRHGFSSQNQNQDRTPTKHDESPSPRKRRKFLQGAGSEKEELAQDDPPPKFKLPVAPLYIRDGNGLQEEGQVIWTDPKTNETFVVDRLTGNSYPLAQHPACHQGGDTTAPPEKTLQRRTFDPIWPQRVEGPFFDGNSSNQKSPMPEWIQKALAANQVYAVTEKKIPSMPSSSGLASNIHVSNYLQAHQHDCNGPGQNPSHCFQNGYSHSDTTGRRFTKGNLLDAQVINQVDRKFIACLIRYDNAGEHDVLCTTADSVDVGPALVLIDQHAADERVRVERFLKELCLGFLEYRNLGDNASGGVQMRDLSPPVPVLLTRHEAMRLGNSHDIQQAFRSWGFVFRDTLPATGSCNSDDGVDDSETSGYTQIVVQSIPEVVSDKLLLGDELRDLIKGFLAKLETDLPLSSIPSKHNPSNDGAHEEEFFWLKALRWCPRELLDLVNSKACRGAIMFNDSLTLAQCEKLVRQLSETAFPFQCAHGRPSLVPLANVGVRSGSSGRRNGSTLQWSNLER